MARSVSQNCCFRHGLLRLAARPVVESNGFPVALFGIVFPLTSPAATASGFPDLGRCLNQITTDKVANMLRHIPIEVGRPRTQSHVSDRVDVDVQSVVMARYRLPQSKKWPAPKDRPNPSTKGGVPMPNSCCCRLRAGLQFAGGHYLQLKGSAGRNVFAPTADSLF